MNFDQFINHHRPDCPDCPDEAIKYSTGQYENLSSTAYHGDQSLGSSSVKILWDCVQCESIAPYLYYLENPDETEAMLKGTLLHTLILEPDKFDKQIKELNIAVRPAGMKFTTTDGRAWKEAHAHMKIVATDFYDDIRTMAKNTRNYPMAMSALTGGIAETSFFATCPKTGLPIKARPDYLIDYNNKLIMVDVKTTRPPVYPKYVFENKCYDRGYHIQQAFYSHVVTSTLERTPNSHYIVTIENAERMLPMVYEMPVVGGDMLDKGFKQMFEALKFLRDYLDADELTQRKLEMYPMGDNIPVLTLPGYARKKEFELHET